MSIKLNYIYPVLLIIISSCLIIIAVKFNFIDHECSGYKYNDVSISSIIITTSVGNIVTAIMLIIDTKVSDKNKLIYQATIGIWLSHLCWTILCLIIGFILIGTSGCKNKNPLMITSWIFIVITLSESIIAIINTVKSIKEYNSYSDTLQYML